MQRLWPDPAAPVDDVTVLVAAEERSPWDDRPWLLVNMIASLDGAVTVDGRSGGLARPADRAMFAALRSVADVVLAGAGTVRAERYGPAKVSEQVRAARRARGQTEVPAVAVVSRSLDLELDSPLFVGAVNPTIVITCEQPSERDLDRVRQVAEVIVCGEQTVDLVAALRELRNRGVGVVTCEGGPRLNADLLVADVIDEWALTVSPLLVGGVDQGSTHGPLPPNPAELVLDRLLEGDGLLVGRWLRVR